MSGIYFKVSRIATFSKKGSSLCTVNLYLCWDAKQGWIDKNCPSKNGFEREQYYIYCLVKLLSRDHLCWWYLKCICFFCCWEHSTLLIELILVAIFFENVNI